MLIARIFREDTYLICIKLPSSVYVIFSGLSKSAKCICVHKKIICNSRGFRIPWNLSSTFLCRRGKLWEIIFPHVHLNQCIHTIEEDPFKFAHRLWRISKLNCHCFRKVISPSGWEYRLWNQSAWIQIPVNYSMTRVTLGKWHNLCFFKWIIVRTTWVNTCKELRIGSGTQ